MFHLLAFDSRGADLQRRIQRNYDGKYHLVVESGANIERLTSVITQALEYVPYTRVYLQVGVNELTTKVGPSIICNYNTTGEIVEDLKTKFLYAENEIIKKKASIKVVLGPLIGISLSRYNKEPWYHQEQDLINDAIMEINRWIKHENAIVRYINDKGRVELHCIDIPSSQQMDCT